MRVTFGRGNSQADGEEECGSAVCGRRTNRVGCSVVQISQGETGWG